MSNAIYPSNLPGRAWPRVRTPLWRTTVAATPSGREWRSTPMASPRYRYVLRYEFLRSKAALPEWQTLFGFYNARQGAYDSFLFSDPDDNTATSQLFGLGDGTTTQFQLVRTLGGYADPVFDLQGAPAIYAGGVLQSSGYTVSATGLVTFSAPPAAAVPLAWTGSYYWRVRFEADELSFEQFMAQFWKTGEVRLITVKP